MRFFLFIFLLLLMPGLQARAGHTVNDDLIYRINFGSADDVRRLLDQGADPNFKSAQGEPTIDMALERNDAESANMAKALIEKGADVEAKDKGGYTPIMNAIRYHQPAVVKILLAHGADYHLKTPEGMTMTDYAKRYGDQDSIDAIDGLYNKESAFEASMRTPERFKEIIDRYAKDSCSYQYWNYILISRQDPSRDGEVKKKVMTIHKSLNDAIIQIQKYYTATSQEALQKVSSMAVDRIYKELDGMISNRNRAESGVGKDEDAKDRCDQIVTDMHIDFVGTLRSTPAEADDGSQGSSDSSTPAPPPLPEPLGAPDMPK